jgi:probable F420-dependent oxidoreductase
VIGSSRGTTRAIAGVGEMVAIGRPRRVRMQDAPGGMVLMKISARCAGGSQHPESAAAQRPAKAGPIRVESRIALVSLEDPGGKLPQPRRRPQPTKRKTGIAGDPPGGRLRVRHRRIRFGSRLSRSPGQTASAKEAAAIEEGKMRFGFNLPNSGKLAAPEIMARIAQEGEALGYDYLTLTDHIALPDLAEPGYPYSESGAFYSSDSAHRHEMLISVAWLAGITRRLRLVLAVLVVPHRPAVLAAKQLATIDVLSGGRLTVGIGAGWLKAEFDAVVVTPFAERGAVTDEYVAAFKTLWTETKPRIAGRYVQYDGLVMAPLPAQLPHPPIWVGGESGPSLRRAARFGDAWYPIGSNQRHLLDTLPRYRAGIERLRGATEAAGRRRDAVELTYRVKRYGEAVAPLASDGNRRLFSGSEADLVGDIHALADLGVTAIDFDFEHPDADAVIAAMRDFRERVLARV